ncbi:MAG TPA: CDP-archaeol synthase [Candidatus Nanoarchaeia archaeon]|nr:CDP-archaeol synthase [Candidatus Nanoarchaeia archaeon]
MLFFIIQALYYFLPAYVANMAPVLFKWLPIGDKPIHQKIFGSHKTWRGLIIAPVMGMLIFWLQKLAYESGFQDLAIIDYSDFSLVLGFLLGGGAILGDLVKSFFKRRHGIKAGQSWKPWDQLDFVFGALALSFFVYVPPAEAVLVLLVFSPILHMLVSYIGFLAKLKKEKF